jgi:PAS domain S-box-containing protein
MMAVLLFLIAIYSFVIPNYRESLMNGKRETIRELTNIAWSVLHKLDVIVDDEFSLTQAQNEAALLIGDMRYGDELKDYFWITDTMPYMIMHPYKPSLNGTNLSEYRDPRGKNFFVDIVNIVREHGDGFVEYDWQWKDDSLTVVPKLSYVKAYKPWGWIVGTGIYIEDVNREIAQLTRNVVWISVLITILLAAIISYLARRNYVADQQREAAQERLRDSMERYKKLVEASTDGVLMILENEVVYCNPYLLNLIGFTQDEFETGDEQFVETIKSFVHFDSDSNVDLEKKDISSEQKIKKKNGVLVNVVINQSKFEIEGKKGFIYAVKDVSRHKDVERELDLSMEKFKSIAGLMSIGVFRCTLGRQSRFVEINAKALELLGYSSQYELKDTHVQELFEVSDEKKEVVKAINEGIHIKDRLLRIRRGDGSILLSMVSLFPVDDADGKTIYCDGVIIDAYDHLSRDVDFNKNPPSLHLSANVLLQQVKDFILPAPQCNMGESVSVAAKLMVSARADVLLVTDNNEEIVGLLTHSDISRRVIAVGQDDKMQIGKIMSSPIISVSDEDMVMDAFTLMMQHNVSYIVVLPKIRGRASYISLLRLSELRKDTPEFLINAIQKAASVYEINEAMNRLPRLINTLIETGTGVATTGKLISKVSDTITEKLINEAIDEVGQPPVPFVFLALGSEGRREQTLATDQDNAIVYQNKNSSDEIQIKDYFLLLGSKVCNSLNKAGYPLCKGGVMAMNKEWCMSIEEWKNAISGWIENPNPEQILKISIFFDFRPVFGDFDLANNLQQFCQKSLKDKNVFLYNLAQSTISLKIHAIESSKHAEAYDIKLPILAITSITRLWALKYGIGERNTLERLFALHSADAISEVVREDFEQACRFLMSLRIKNQLKQIEANSDINNIINPKNLSDIERIMLKKVVATISDHQARLSMEFRII